METTTKITIGLNGEWPWVSKSQLMSLQSTLFLRVRKYHIKHSRKVLYEPENHGTCEVISSRHDRDVLLIKSQRMVA